MKASDLTKVRATLWAAADELRANSKLTPGQYRDPNAGSVNIDEYLRRLIELSKALTAEEERAVREGMTEVELAIFDLLTHLDPVLTDEEREAVKASAKKLLEHLHENLVQDWRRKVATTNEVNSTIRRILDQSLPETPYTVDIFQSKVQLIYNHVPTAYGDNRDSAYTVAPTSTTQVRAARPTLPAASTSIASQTTW